MYLTGKKIAIFIFWVGFNGLIVSVFPLLNPCLPFSTPANTLTALMASAVFFVVFLLPLLLPAMLSNPGNKNSSPSVSAFFTGVFFLMLFMPLFIMASAVAGTSAAIVLKMSLILVTLFILAISVCLLRNACGNAVMHWYYLWAFVITAGIPLIKYIAGEFTNSSFALSFDSPVAAVIAIGCGKGQFAGQCIFQMLIAIIAAVIYYLRANNSAGPENA